MSYRFSDLIDRPVESEYNKETIESDLIPSSSQEGEKIDWNEFVSKAFHTVDSSVWNIVRRFVPLTVVKQHFAGKNVCLFKEEGFGYSEKHHEEILSKIDNFWLIAREGNERFVYCNENKNAFLEAFPGDKDKSNKIHYNLMFSTMPKGNLGYNTTELGLN